MKEYRFGNMNRRELCLRLYSPMNMRAWRGKEWVFSWKRALDPRRWWRVAWSRFNWQFHWKRFDGNHRCYCPEGTMFDGRVIICGFGAVWFYSHFVGEIPCPCDEVSAELDREREQLEAHPIHTRN